MFMGGSIGKVMGHAGIEMEVILKRVMVEEPLQDF